MKTSTVLRKEVGWAGHFICAKNCLFRRNTHLRKDDTIIIVSTVGSMLSPLNKKFEEIGLNRYYETMVFYSDNKPPYFDIDVSKQISVNEKWYISTQEYKDNIEIVDNLANEMHENIVIEITNRMRNGELLK